MLVTSPAPLAVRPIEEVLGYASVYAMFRLNVNLLDDRAAQQMPVREFRRQFLAALGGEKNMLSAFVRADRCRPLAHEWRALRAAVFARDNYTCGYCGERGGRLECDHILPVAQGGGHDMENLTTACRPCNRQKRDKTLAEWLG